MTEIPTKCDDWSLNEEDAESETPGKRFWWNRTYSISVWANQLDFGPAVKEAHLDDHKVWRAYIQFQLRTVYKLCSICNGPETEVDMRVCCYCGNTVHLGSCCVPCDKEQIAWKPANRGFEKHLVCCLACDDKMPADDKKRPIEEHTDDARRAAIRTLTIGKEIGDELAARCSVVLAYPDMAEKEKMDEVQNVNAAFFQPGGSAAWLDKRPCPHKGGGLGVFAKCDIPRFSIVGVYPGYEDPLSGEHAKAGRPGPRYSLVDLNCADYFNRVFVEFDKCFTPFINEPNPDQHSNVAWIQESCRDKGRLSVMAVRDIKAGEEVCIGYGPLYPRTYPYNYDAFALHSVDGYEDPPCFALWHWTTKEEKDAEFVCYVEYQADKDLYVYWETEEEREEAQKQTAGAGGSEKQDGAAPTPPKPPGSPLKKE